MPFSCYAESAISRWCCLILSKGLIPLTSVTALILNIIILVTLLRIRLPSSQHLPFNYLIITHIMSSLSIWIALIEGHSGLVLHTAFFSLSAYMIFTMLIGGWCQINIPTEFLSLRKPLVQHCWFIICSLWVIIAQLCISLNDTYSSTLGAWTPNTNGITLHLISSMHRVVPQILIGFFIIWLKLESYNDRFNIVSLIQSSGITFWIANILFIINMLARSLDSSDVYQAFKIFIELLSLHFNIVFLYVFNHEFKQQIHTWIGIRKKKNKSPTHPLTPFCGKRHSVNRKLLDNDEVKLPLNNSPIPESESKV